MAKLILPPFKNLIYYQKLPEIELLFCSYCLSIVFLNNFLSRYHLIFVIISLPHLAKMAPRIHSITKFRESLLHADSPFHSWIGKSNSDTEIYCKFCKKNVSISKMGEAALRSHMKSRKHLDLSNASKSTPSAWA